MTLKTRFQFHFSNRAVVSAAALVLMSGGFLGRAWAENLVIDSMEPAESSVRLLWQGGNGPFQIESTRDLQTWSDLGRPVEGSEGTFPMTGNSSYYRIRDLGVNGLGAHIGTLEVMQGEFGNAFARHRLKGHWDAHLPADQAPSSIPSEFFRQLVMRYQHVNGTQVETHVGTFESLPDGSARVAGDELTFTWTLGEQVDQRDFTLVLNFPYNITQPRSSEILLSDPFCALTCRYATPQPVIEWDNSITLSTEDEVELAEISQADGPEWWTRDQTVEVGAVAVHSNFSVGLPVYQGSPPFIWKTYILQRWNTPTTVSGITAQPFQLAGNFSRSYYPGHHNFWETLYLEPQLEPGIDPSLLEALRAANIRIIIPMNPTAFPESNPTIHVLGFDGIVREL